MSQAPQTQSSTADKPRIRDQVVPLGRTVMTRSVADLVASGRINPLRYIARHRVCDWGDVCAEDWRANNLAMRMDERLLSAYHVSKELTVWVITEWDRSVTTILLPSDY